MIYRGWRAGKAQGKSEFGAGVRVEGNLLML